MGKLATIDIIIFKLSDYCTGRGGAKLLRGIAIILYTEAGIIGVGNFKEQTASDGDWDIILGVCMKFIHPDHPFTHVNFTDGVYDRKVKLEPGVKLDGVLAEC